jgi:hypothetical protein
MPDRIGEGLGIKHLHQSDGWGRWVHTHGSSRLPSRRQAKSLRILDTDSVCGQKSPVLYSLTFVQEANDPVIVSSSASRSNHQDTNPRTP